MDANRRHDPSSHATRGLSRRTALGRLAGVGAAAALFAAVGPDTARATPAEANTFELDGEETRITYTWATEEGVPQLTYQGRRGDRTFVGDEIRAEESELFGRLVTVHLGEFHAGFHELTLLLPTFGPMAIEDAPLRFATLAIVTTHHTAEGGVVHVENWARQSYEDVELQGTAGFFIS